MSGIYNKEYLFINNGTPMISDFTLITSQLVTPLYDQAFQAPCLCDIDNDEDEDLFIALHWGAISYYLNIGSPDSAQYVLVDTIFAGINIPCGPSMDFIDIEHDGDYDLFIGVSWNTQNGRLYFYRNDGTPEIPDMIFITDYFENIDVGGQSAPEFCDIDADGDYDLFVGCEDGNVWFYENIGDSINYDFQFVTSNYFSIDVGNMSVPRFCDIDADGDFDLFVGNGSGGESVGFVGDMDFYENIGSPTDPDFQFVTGQYLFMDMNGSSSPCVVDIDDDGLDEILVGIVDGDIILLENDGTYAEPSFYYADSAYFNILLCYQPSMSFGDMDADGDLDMAAVELGFYSSVGIYENIGSASNPVFSYFNYQQIAGGPFESYAGIELFDIDADGDLDLFFGGNYTTIQYWRNEGTPERHRFVFQTDNYLNQPIVGGSAYPRFGDLDHDGDYDLIIGGDIINQPIFYGSYIIYWENVGNPQNAVFVESDTIYISKVSEEYEYGNPRPSLSDIDNDGDLDMFVGESGGAMLFYRNLEDPPPPSVSVVFTPESASIQIPPGGGSFTFDVEIYNGDSLNYIIDASTDVTLPNSSAYPLILRPNINLQA
ncbi:MAG: VCBS repeat-containing protein, partial [FCB group bacterium]|nr:VCBS repeat-containing protein [FCB group bacterium]